MGTLAPMNVSRVRKKEKMEGNTLFIDNATMNFMASNAQYATKSCRAIRVEE
jgi:hypothetical protein